MHALARAEPAVAVPVELLHERALDPAVLLLLLRALRAILWIVGLDVHRGLDIVGLDVHRTTRWMEDLVRAGGGGDSQEGRDDEGRELHAHPTRHVVKR